MPPETRIGTVTLRVADLERSIRFYRDILGFRTEESKGSSTTLYAGHTALVRLVEHPGIPPRPADRSGLFHIAILLPDRESLAAAFRHLLQNGIHPAASDHIVSEALYLNDPDGNGIEIYADRPADTWRWSDGEVAMATERLDARSLLAAAPPEQAEYRLPPGTVIGHIHLQVGDLAEARRFYTDALGFDVTTQSYPGALFVSAGGYHHHIGLNIWRSRGPEPAPDDAAGLDSVEFVLPPDGIPAVQERLARSGASIRTHTDGFETQDPWRNRIRIRAA